jgi:hypothetical protein
MTPTAGDLKTIDASAIKLLANCPGPCITILLPSHHPGANDGSRGASVRRLIRTIGKQLAAGKLADQAPELMAPLEDLAGPEIEAGGPGVAIFRSSRYLAHYRTNAVKTERVVIASHFHLTPLLSAAFVPKEFFILDINKKLLRLLQLSHGECRELTLPASVPPNMEAAGDFAKHAHDLAGHSSSGGSAGAAQATHFAMLSERDAAGDYFHHFLSSVDKGVMKTLDGAPLMLAGVHEEITAYRRAAKYPHILNSEVRGNTEFMPLNQMAARAVEMVLADYYMKGQRVLQEYQEMTDRARVLNGVREVLEAAAQGRVQRLCVAEGAESPGPLEREISSTDIGDEDLVNAAVAQTLRMGGEIFALPADRMAEAGPLAAILRY